MLALIRSCMCDLMPRTEALPGLADTDIDGFLRRMRRESHLIYWLGLVSGAVTYTLTPLLTVGVPLPAFLLPARLRAEHARRVCDAGPYLIRQTVFLLRLSAGMCWGQDPRVRAHFALAPYPPDPGSFRA